MRLAPLRSPGRQVELDVPGSCQRFAILGFMCCARWLWYKLQQRWHLAWRSGFSALVFFKRRGSSSRRQQKAFVGEFVL